jgi:acetyl esterase/lipase
MFGLLAFVGYLYLKILVSFSRLLIKPLASSPRRRPDYQLQVPSRDKHRTIKVHVYKPPVKGDGSSDPAPVLINLYGSGLAIPLHGVDDDFCRYVAEATGYSIID